MTNLYPSTQGQDRPLDNISISYQMSASNRVTNNWAGSTGESAKDSIGPLYHGTSATSSQTAQGYQHTMPVSIYFKVLRFFTVTPTVSLTDVFEKLHWRYVQATNGGYVAKADTAREFNHI